ncbi:MAG: hypothetical protein Q8R60_15585 [Mycobacteriales bacterium]|nr:hypothetical protein [Mycobacteriales bacterium]
MTVGLNSPEGSEQADDALSDILAQHMFAAAIVSFLAIGLSFALDALGLFALERASLLPAAATLGAIVGSALGVGRVETSSRGLDQSLRETLAMSLACRWGTRLGAGVASTGMTLAYLLVPAIRT